MDTQKSQSCAERIKANYRSRVAEIMRVTGKVTTSRKWLTKNEMPDDVNERIDSYMSNSVLEFAKNGHAWGVKIPRYAWHVTVLLSYGGPADGFILSVKRNRYGYEIDSVWYFYSDWFDGANMKVHAGSQSESAIKDLFESYVENMVFDSEEE